MKKGDLIIIIVVFIAAITFGNFVSTGKLDDTKTVIVVKDGKEIHRYRIDENYEKTIRIENSKLFRFLFTNITIFLFEKQFIF